MHISFLTLSAVFPATFAHPKQKAAACPLVFDGRVPASATGATFDSGTLPYNPDYDLGANLNWADVLKFPSTPKSLFDTSDTKSVEVTIDDRAIFTPSPDNAQTGFRRNELLPQPEDATGSVTGVKTLHWSMMTDVQRPLNYSHEYQLVWLESQDYSANQFSLNAGRLYGSGGGANKVLQLRGSSNANPQQTLWKTEFTDGVWHSLALKLNFNTNQLQVLYSQGDKTLVAQTGTISNDLSNLGQFHFGVLKKPTGPAGDITKQGFQESGIDEGVTYSGVFEEDSASGCVSVAQGVRSAKRRSRWSRWGWW